jgi:hypothetical protein
MRGPTDGNHYVLVCTHQITLRGLFSVCHHCHSLTVRIVSVLPVASVISRLLHTLQDQRMSLAKIWNA